MYEIHPNFADQWVLFDTGAGSFDVVAWFHGREDAEFAREAFELRRRQSVPISTTRWTQQESA
jgi:hypothetical protein